MPLFLSQRSTAWRTWNPVLRYACIYVLRCMCEVKSPLQIISKGSNNILCLQWGESKRHLLSRVCERVLTAAVPREWMNKHSAWQDTSKCSHKMSNLPPSPLALVIPSHSLLSHPGKDSQRRVFLTYFQWPLNVAWLAWSIFCTLVSSPRSARLSFPAYVFLCPVFHWAKPCPELNWNYRTRTMPNT